MTYTAKSASETVIFVIENNKVVETNLYDHVIESAEETTSPIGISTKIFVHENEEDGTWEVRSWGVGGRGPSKLVTSHLSEDEAEDEWFTRIHDYDFMPDDQRDTEYWLTEEEAEAALEDRKKYM